MIIDDESNPLWIFSLIENFSHNIRRLHAMYLICVLSVKMMMNNLKLLYNFMGLKLHRT